MTVNSRLNLNLGKIFHIILFFNVTLLKYSLFRAKINIAKEISAPFNALTNPLVLKYGNVYFMSEYNDFEFKNNNRDNEPDYYAMYVNEKTKEARSVFSRYHLSLFLFLVIANAVVIFARLVLTLFIGKSGYIRLVDNAYAPLIFNVVSMYLIAFPVFVLLTKNMKTEKREMTKMGAGEFLSLLLICEFLMFAGNLIGQFLNKLIGKLIGNEINNSLNELVDNSPVWLLFAVAVIIGPIIEELMFRKFMIDRLSRYGDLLAIIVSSVSFGLFHGNFYQFFYAAMFGFILGYIYTKTRNIKYSILMHMIINFLGSVAVLPLVDIIYEFLDMLSALGAGEIIDYSTFIKYALIACSYSLIQYTLYIAGAAVLVIYISRRMFKFENKCEYSLPKEKRVGIVLLNVGTIIFLLSSIAMFAINIFEF